MTLTQVAYDRRLNELDYSIVCPTLGRADVIKNKLLKLLPHTTLLVHESEEALYSTHNPDSVVDTTRIMGCAPTFSYAWNHYKDETLILIDDDIVGCKVIVGQRPRKYPREEDVLQAIENMINVSRGIGATFFASGNVANPMMYRGLDPFYLGSKIPGACKGLNGYPRKVQVDPRLKARDDVCIMMEAMVKDHFTYHDTRLYFINGEVEAGKGGNQLTKTNTSWENDVAVLNGKYGNMIEIVQGKGWAKKQEVISCKVATKNDKVKMLFR